MPKLEFYTKYQVLFSFNTGTVTKTRALKVSMLRWDTRIKFPETHSQDQGWQIWGKTWPNTNI